MDIDPLLEPSPTIVPEAVAEPFPDLEPFRSRFVLPRLERQPVRLLFTAHATAVVVFLLGALAVNDWCIAIVAALFLAQNCLAGYWLAGGYFEVEGRLGLAALLALCWGLPPVFTSGRFGALLASLCSGLFVALMSALGTLIIVGVFRWQQRLIRFRIRQLLWVTAGVAMLVAGARLLEMNSRMLLEALYFISVVFLFVALPFLAIFGPRTKWRWPLVAPSLGWVALALPIYRLKWEESWQVFAFFVFCQALIFASLWLLRRAGWRPLDVRPLQAFSEPVAPNDSPL